MKYMLMIYEDEARLTSQTGAQGAQVMAAYNAYAQALIEAKAMLGGNRLRPSETATQVRVSEGKTAVLNGPYAETREQLGGFYLIEVADLDAALAWAARCPGASHGTMEVRPIWDME